MKKILLTFLLLYTLNLVYLFIFIPTALAQSASSYQYPICVSRQGVGIPTAIGCIPFTDYSKMELYLVNWAVGIGGGLAFVFIVFAGFKIMTSSGDPQRLQGGKELMGTALSGLIMIVFSVFILRILGVNVLGLFP